MRGSSDSCHYVRVLVHLGIRYEEQTYELCYCGTILTEALRRVKFYCLILDAFGVNIICLSSQAHCSVIIYLTLARVSSGLGSLIPK
jgi:hypothetical protein